jgi:hypothetical protein
MAGESMNKHNAFQSVAIKMVRIDRTHSKDDSSGSKTTVNPVAGMPPLPSGPSIVHLPNGAEANEDYCSWTIYFGRNTVLIGYREGLCLGKPRAQILEGLKARALLDSDRAGEGESHGVGRQSQFHELKNRGFRYIRILEAP